MDVQPLDHHKLLILNFNIVAQIRPVSVTYPIGFVVFSNSFRSGFDVTRIVLVEYTNLVRIRYVSCHNGVFGADAFEK